MIKGSRRGLSLVSFVCQLQVTLLPLHCQDFLEALISRRKMKSCNFYFFSYFENSYVRVHNQHNFARTTNWDVRQKILTSELV